MLDHYTPLCNNIRVARKYELKRRAERQDETRQRIVDAAVHLHTTIGPARTSVSAVAERAGVERHTVYRHFPDERSLFLACSSQHAERRPMPDAEAWTAITDPEIRLRRGLSELYAYYAEHGAELVPILRDLDVHPLTRETVELRLAPALGRIRDVLAQPFRARGKERARLHAMLDVVVDLRSFLALARHGSPGERVEVAVRAVLGQRVR
jgi:AcrR family transcriptional regulator